jgi:FxsC-like protein
MALANVAWILAANRKRVAVIDWDLEAPGLHRYFQPYLDDPDLLESSGIIDFVMTYAREAIKPAKAEPDPSWYVPYANLLRHATSLRYDFPQPGTIDFIPSGRQGPDYATRVNSFNWSAFYENQQGGIFLEAAKQSLAAYDYVLIDSRTGVSDTSGICTVQMPHVLVVCFTPNAQSIEGASAIARSADQQRTRPDGTRTLRVLPVMMRVLAAEKQRVDAAKRSARERFDGVLWHLAGDAARERYWGRMPVPQEPFYAFEEVLAVFGDEPGQPNTMLASMEHLAGHIAETRSPAANAQEWPLKLPKLSDAARQTELAKFVKFAAPPAPAPVPLPREKAPIRTMPAALPLEPGGVSGSWIYVSYARADMDVYLQRFCDDLARRVEALTAAESDRTIFFDRSLERGRPWPDMVANALAKSRMMVAIISPGFIRSDYCGKEWQVFSERADLASRPTSAILPVVWVPLRLIGPLPSAISHINLFGHDVPDAYREKGLSYLVRLRRGQYYDLIGQLAQELVAWHREAPLPPLKELPRFDSVVNAFGDLQDRDRPPSGSDVVPFLLLTADRAEMAHVRTQTRAYGEGAVDWTPYPPRTVASWVADATSSDRRMSTVVTFSETEKARFGPNQPLIVIIDPWALKLDHVRQQLKALDQYEPTNWGYVVVFDAERDTQAAEIELRQLLADALPRTYRSRSQKISEVRTEGELIRSVILMMTTIQLDFISRAENAPRPILSGPELPKLP